ncbi:AAA family ATPase [Methylomonas sp. EFPC3]|uniref:AAA family ATPase n=1 Tax=Methylomonas sp. EFPC3 TaxID=3021710 RepID=UPI002417A8A0|nr:AAA family ATPase [Methylomonas sp. EFPC3]WFP48925.1 AAA family ATPase [Methylomonas sp. EFPC3]
MTEANEGKIDSLNSEIEQFAESLPYWAKYLSSKLLSGESISYTDIDTAYSYVLEDAGLKPSTEKPAIVISCDNASCDGFKDDLLLTSLQNLKGVNALVENQKIEFCPQVTIVYGVNGSGKTGYTRLLKKAFHSRSTEDILPNIHVASGHSNVSAEISFTSKSKLYALTYPDHKQQNEFRQFSIFDNKCVNVHLTNRNQFEFRPAGLDFFGDLIEAFKKIEEKITADITNKSVTKDYPSLFDGESDIKNVLNTLSAKTQIDDLKKLIPITEEEKKKRSELEEQMAQLQTLKKDKEIADLNDYKELLTTLKISIADNNKFFTAESLSEIKTAISDCLSKDDTAKTEGIESFKTDKIMNVGSKEWKGFITAAQDFAKQQVGDNEKYPKADDYCILCQQPLSIEAQKLIASYWIFIKSQSEQDAKNAQTALNTHNKNYEELNFDLLPENGVLTKWMLEKHKKETLEIKEYLQKQKALSESIISDLTTKTANNRTAIQTDTTHIDRIVQGIEGNITKLQENDPTADIKKLQDSITYLNHKEKLEQHITGIETYVSNLKWAATATKAKGKISKRKITDKEKELSGKYFNEAYVRAFNDECKSLNCEIGINISHTGSAGTSYRQLFLKGKEPSKILSEGEQKIISLADFLAEIKLSEITCGVIFDDPVTSLDDERKGRIAERIAEESTKNQVVVFTHDLVFVSTLISACCEFKVDHVCHWIEKRDDTPGYVFLNNAPSYEKQYRNSVIPRRHYDEANKTDCPPAQREYLVKSAFTELRTCYEVLVINDLFNNVVQRFNERVSVESLKDVCFDEELKTELLDNFGKCCRYMEGHTHSDKYAYQKPTVENLNAEINRYETIRTKIKRSKKRK